MPTAPRTHVPGPCPATPPPLSDPPTPHPRPPCRNDLLPPQAPGRHRDGVPRENQCSGVPGAPGRPPREPGPMPPLEGTRERLAQGAGFVAGLPLKQGLRVSNRSLTVS